MLVIRAVCTNFGPEDAIDSLISDLMPFKEEALRLLDHASLPSAHGQLEKANATAEAAWLQSRANEMSQMRKIRGKGSEKAA